MNFLATKHAPCLANSLAASDPKRTNGLGQIAFALSAVFGRLHLARLILAVVALVLSACEQQPAGPGQAFGYKERPRAYPPEMEASKSAHLDSALEYNAIEARPATTEPWDSKFLGHPYLPNKMEYPRGKDGSPLTLLAQINFSDMPKLKDFPDQGILQFYISAEESKDHVWGALQYRGEPFDPDAYFRSQMTQDYFRVIYHEHVLEDERRIQLSTPPIPDGFLPIDREARLTFSRKTGYVLNDDYRFPHFFKTDAITYFKQFGELANEVGDQYFRFNHPFAQAWVGGYAAFAQSDPRGLRPDEDWVLLLEIESSDEHGLDVLWGDVGVGTFFIQRSSLQRRDFSEVLYYWDNH